MTLTLSDTQIDEDGGQSTTLTVKLSHPSSEDTTVTVSADPDDTVTLSPNPLTISAGNTSGTVTLTAEDNDIDGPERKRVTICGGCGQRPRGHGPGQQDPDDCRRRQSAGGDAEAVSENAIDESGVDNNVTVTASLDRASSVQIVVTVATASTYTLSTPRTLTIPVGETESTGTPVTLTAKDNDIDADDAMRSLVGGTASGGLDVDGSRVDHP